MMEDQNDPVVRLIIEPGTASAEEIGEFLAELSKLYRMMGGSGIKYTVKKEPRR